MGTIAERYDQSAGRYLTWWAPVLRPMALDLLDRLERRLGRPSGAASSSVPVREILDLGTGTGTLALETLRRWPEARVTGVDASGGMLGVAKAEAERRIPAPERRRIGWVSASAERLPFEAGSIDLIVSSFVLQLVADRRAALREAFRVLRPGGTLAFVTWRVGETRLGPDDTFDDLLDELGIPDESDPEEARAGDLASATATAAQLRRLGFRAVAAHEAILEHAFGREGYLDFLMEYDRRDLIDGLDGATRAALREGATARFARLGLAAFTWRAPIVFALARRPADEPAPAATAGPPDRLARPI
jgi:ubiquinone/menaquinone biosynthesis C-methylase UbiE